MSASGILLQRREACLRARAHTAQTVGIRTISTDEQGHQTIEFTDGRDRKYWKKDKITATDRHAQAARILDGSARTMYMMIMATFDSLFRQCGGSGSTVPWTLDQRRLDELCFRYEYDLLTGRSYTGTRAQVREARERYGRCLMYGDDGHDPGRKNAGSVAGSMDVAIYNDNLDRQVMTGVINSANTLSQMQTMVTAQTAGNGYGTLSAGVTHQRISVRPLWLVINNNPLPSGVLIDTAGGDFTIITMGFQLELAVSLDQTYTSNSTYYPDEL